METKKQTKTSRFKTKRFWIQVGVVLLLLSIGYGIGQSATSEEFDGLKVNYDEAVKLVKEKENKVVELEEKITEAEKELAVIENEIDNRQQEFDDVMKIIENRDSIQAEIEDLNAKVSEKEGLLSELDTQIQAKEDELAALEGRIRETGEQPVELPSGTFVVGQDLPANRYSASAAGGSGNFVVYSVGGSLKVNQILGDWGVSEHVFYADEGDVIETTIPTRLTPVQ